MYLDVTPSTESLNELEDNELDALVADLESKSVQMQSSTAEDTCNPTENQTSPPAVYQEAEPVVTFPVVTTQSSKVIKMVRIKIFPKTLYMKNNV